MTAASEESPTTTFADLGLPDALLATLAEVGYESPSPIQAATIPPLLAGRDAENVLDTFLFAGNANLVRDVMVDGEWVVRDFRHRDEDAIAVRYRQSINRISAPASHAPR